MAPTESQIAMTIELLPDKAADYGWDAAKVIERWANTVYRTVREFWVDRTNDTAGYLDLSNQGLPASQLHAQAKAMLEYWDEMIATSEKAEEESAAAAGGLRSFAIKRV